MKSPVRVHESAQEAACSLASQRGVLNTAALC